MAKVRKVTKKEAKKEAPAKKVTSKPSLFRATLVAFAILAVLFFVFDGIVLRPIWNAMEIAGVIRGGSQTLPMIYWFVLLFISALALAWLVSRANISSNCEALIFGLVLGVLPAFMDVSAFLFYRVPAIMPLVGVLLDLGSFSFATWAAWRVNR